MKRFIFVLLIFTLVFSVFSAGSMLVFAEDAVACEHTYDNCLDTDCNLCGETRVAPGHSFTTWTNNNDASCDQSATETSICDNCGAESIRVLAGTSLPHQYGEWTVITEATSEADGLKEQTCSVCGDVNSEVIPKISTETDNGGEEEEQEEMSDAEEFASLMDELGAALEDLFNEFVGWVTDLTEFIENDETYSTVFGVILAVLAAICIPFLVAILVIAYIAIALIVVIAGALMSLLEALVGVFAGFIV